MGGPNVDRPATIRPVRVQRKLAGLIAVVALSGVGFAASGDSAAIAAPEAYGRGVAAASPEPTLSPSPTLEPSPSPTPSLEPTPTLTPEPSPTPIGGPVTNFAPLPKCGTREVAALVIGYDDWNLTLVDTNYTVGKGYVPPDLKDVGGGGSGFYWGTMVRAVAVPDLRAMVAAARSAGAPLAVFSSYRDYRTQVWTYNYWVNTLGAQTAALSSARAGHSEHQLGVAIDFKSAGGPDPWSTKNWARDTAAGKWMAANAWRYGFVMSYPWGKTAVTCYGFEPWHYRYVGRVQADAIYHSGLTLREWLWQHQPDQSLPQPTREPGAEPI